MLHLQIRQWMDEGNLVIVDRYVYSNIAFQCAKLADPEGTVMACGTGSWNLSLDITNCPGLI